MWKLWRRCYAEMGKMEGGKLGYIGVSSGSIDNTGSSNHQRNLVAYIYLGEYLLFVHDKTAEMPSSLGTTVERRSQSLCKENQGPARAVSSA